MTQVIIRPFKMADAPAIAQLFHDTIHYVNAQDYRPAQLQAWAPAEIHFQDWATQCRNYWTIVAESAEAELLGFAQLHADGMIGCFYCHWRYQRQGIGQQLYQAIASRARAIGLSQLTVEASITAKPFFLAQGFHIRRAQTVTCRGERFINYQMASHTKKIINKKPPCYRRPGMNLEVY